MSVEQKLKSHYTQGGLLAAIDESLRGLGKDPAAVSHDDLAPVDELHTGGRPATIAFLAMCGFAPGTEILDVGSGLGGPARTCAVTCGARVYGIDLTPEFVEVAQELSRRCGLSDRTEFHAGSALEMPFASGRFDGATMVHVGMNIPDKDLLFREVRRVLKPGATFGIYDVMRAAEGGIAFPLPWSSSPETSIVESAGRYRDALAAAGFEVVAEQDRLQPALAFIAEQFAKAAAGKMPRLLHRGPNFKEKSLNYHAALKSGLLAPRIIVARTV